MIHGHGTFLTSTPKIEKMFEFLLKRHKRAKLTGEYAEKCLRAIG
jgi:hypothetical protein